MFPEINYFKQFLRKNIIKMKDFFTMCSQNWKEDEDYMQVAYKKIHLFVLQVNSTSLIDCSSTKIHNNTYKMSTSVKELTVCQNTFSHVEITTLQPCSINKQEHYSKALYYKTPEKRRKFLLSQWNHWYWLKALYWWGSNIAENT